MTLLVGIQCTDGVVLGAESSASLGTDGGDVNDLARKITLIGDHALIGLAGSSTTGQHYENAIRAELKKLAQEATLHCTPHADLALNIGSRTSDIFLNLKLKEVAAKTYEEFGGERVGDVLAYAMLATVTEEGPCLVRIDALGGCETCAKFPYAVEGVGSKVATPFLRYIRHHVWKEKPPDIGAGIISVLWALRYACLVMPDKLAKPHLIGVVERKNGRAAARFLNKIDLTYQNNLLDDFERDQIGGLLSAPMPADTVDLGGTPALGPSGALEPTP